MAICVATLRFCSGVSSGCRDDDLFQRFFDQVIHQVVGLDAESLASRDLHVRPLAVFFGERDAEIGAAARRKRHHLIREVRGAIGLFVVAESAQPGHHHVLQV